MTVIVSAYYKIPSKQPHAFYVSHLRRWFGAIQEPPVIFFTTPDVEEEIRSWDLPLANITFIHLPFAELTGWSLGPDFWNRQKARDPEPYHTPELGVVWYEKMHFVRRAMDLLPHENQFIWCDAGCVRDDLHMEAAKEFGMRNVTLPDGFLFFQQLVNGQRARYYGFPYRNIAGAIQAGTRSAWAKHIALYDTVLREYDTAGITANSDQYVSLSCADRVPNQYSLVPVKDWFQFLWFF